MFRQQPRQHLRDGRAVVGGRRGHQHHQQQAHAIEDDMPLPAPQFLARVIAPDAADRGLLDRLAVDAGDLGRGVLSGGEADLAAAGLKDGLPGTIDLPSFEVVVAGALGRQVVR